MHTGKSRNASNMVPIVCTVISGAGLIGSLVGLFNVSASTQISEAQAICVQTGPVSFQIVDIQNRLDPLVLHGFRGNFDMSGGIINRSIVIARNDYAVAEMNLDKGYCAMSERSGSPHIRGHYYQLKKQP